MSISYEEFIESLHDPALVGEGHTWKRPKEGTYRILHYEYDSFVPIDVAGFQHHHHRWLPVNIPIIKISCPTKGVAVDVIRCTSDTYTRTYPEFQRFCGVCSCDHHVHIRIKLRTPRGGYTVRAHQLPSEFARLDDLAAFHELRVSEVQGPSDVRPRKFKPAHYIQSGHFVTRTSAVSRAKFVGFVAIENDFTFNQETVAQPGRECWYLFKCRGYGGGTFYIVTDLEHHWYPTVKTSVKHQDGDPSRMQHEAVVGKLQSGLHSGTSVDLSQISEYDLELFKEAFKKAQIQ